LKGAAFQCLERRWFPVLELSIGLGLAVSLLVSELFGLASAGLVVPGYLALFLDQPARLLGTFAMSLTTWLIVRQVLDRIMVLYGRRRFAVTVLTGFLLNMVLARTLRMTPFGGLDVRSIGFIIPGLIASEMLSQGVFPATLATLLVAGVVRTLLWVFAGWQW
jgi:poly-gamma-glutamate biosynthesis protein PgsC/CapC